MNDAPGFFETIDAIPGGAVFLDEFSVPPPPRPCEFSAGRDPLCGGPFKAFAGDLAVCAGHEESALARRREAGRFRGFSGGTS